VPNPIGGMRASRYSALAWFDLFLRHDRRSVSFLAGAIERQIAIVTR
jgi:hypothetical protein